MAHESSDRLTCPYCDHVHDDIEGAAGLFTCEACERDFTFATFVHVTYSSYKLSCEESSSEHVFKDPDRTDYDEDWARRYPSSEIGFSIWGRLCENCDHEDLQRTALRAPCPWPSEAPVAPSVVEEGAQ